jgi:meiotically up-regulated gene 157 (Mug157) protein
LAVQGLTSTDHQERLQLIAMLRDCDAGTGLMHESFHPDRPEEFTRPWFAWATTLFAEFLIETYAWGQGTADRSLAIYLIAGRAYSIGARGTFHA